MHLVQMSVALGVAWGLATTPVWAQGNAEGFQTRAIRERIEARFLERIQADLGLTPEVAQQVQSLARRHAIRRMTLDDAQRRVRTDLQRQMRPGIAADQAQVGILLDSLMVLRVAYVKSFQDELAELAPVLTPVQRTQFFIARDRLYQRAQEIRQQRPPQQRRPRER